MTEGAPDTMYYQLPPYRWGAGHGVPVDYHLHNPAPASPQYAPVPTDPYGSQRSQPLPGEFSHGAPHGSLNGKSGYAPPPAPPAEMEPQPQAPAMRSPQVPPPPAPTSNGSLPPGTTQMLPNQVPVRTGRGTDGGGWTRRLLQRMGRLPQSDAATAQRRFTGSPGVQTSFQPQMQPRLR
jgi:hypothetical protein